MVSMIREYIANRDAMIERHKGAGRVLMGNASKPTQLQFIKMCNEESVRFANLFDDRLSKYEWDQMVIGFGKMLENCAAGRRSLSFPRLYSEFSPRVLVTIPPSMSLTELEGAKELASTYAAILHMDDAS